MPWRRSLRNGIVFGLVLAFHAGLALFMLSGRSAIRFHRPVSASSSHDALLVELLPPTGRAPTARSAAPTMVANAAPAPRLRVVASRPLSRSEKAPPAQGARVVPQHPLDLELPPSDTASGFGNHAWHQALRLAQAGHAPQVPGKAAGESVTSVRLITRKALKQRVEAAGKFMNCSIAIMKRHAQSDTPQQINHAHDESGCTK